MKFFMRQSAFFSFLFLHFSSPPLYRTPSSSSSSDKICSSSFGIFRYRGSGGLPKSPFHASFDNHRRGESPKTPAIGIASWCVVVAAAAAATAFPIPILGQGCSPFPPCPNAYWWECALESEGKDGSGEKKRGRGRIAQMKQQAEKTFRYFCQLIKMYFKSGFKYWC